MRKLIAIAAAALVVVALVFGWYWGSPFFSVASLRNAAVRGDTKELNERVDFARLREELKTQISTLLITRMTEDLRGNPFAALGVALGAKLTDILIDTMVTPAGLASLLGPTKDRTPDEVSGLRLMLSPDFVVHRDGLSTFGMYAAKERDKLPALRFSRDGLSWRLVGIHMPDEVLATKLGDAVGESRSTAPFVPKWELSDRRDPMDDTVRVFLTRGADEELNTRFSRVRPRVIFTCQKNNLDAYIYVGSAVALDYQSHSTSVRLRFDNDPPTRDKWSVSDDRDALFAPNAKLFLRSFLNAESLQFEWPQLGGAPTVAKFTRDDLETHATRFTNACGDFSLAERPREPVTYVVPIAAFANAEKVQQLQAILVANRIVFYKDELQTSKGPVVRVRAGPYATREEAEKVREKIATLGLRPGALVERQ